MTQLSNRPWSSSLNKKNKNSRHFEKENVFNNFFTTVIIIIVNTIPSLTYKYIKKFYIYMTATAQWDLCHCFFPASAKCQDQSLSVSALSHSEFNLFPFLFFNKTSVEKGSFIDRCHQSHSAMLPIIAGQCFYPKKNKCEALKHNQGSNCPAPMNTRLLPHPSCQTIHFDQLHYFSV